MSKIVSIVGIVLLLSFLSSRSQAQDNLLYLKGGVVQIEQNSYGSIATSRWYIKLKTTVGITRVECVGSSVSSAKSACSTLVNTGNGIIPHLLYTGGCMPIMEAVSGSNTENDPLIKIWECGGNGEGLCRISTGYALPNSDHLDGISHSLIACF